MYGITQILIVLLVVSISRVSPEKDGCDLNLGEVFRTPRDFSRVNFDHFEILERNNFDQPRASLEEPISYEGAQPTHHPKSVANAQVMLRFGGDDIHGRNRIDASDKTTHRPEYNRPGHQHNHHLLHNDMGYSPNYPSYPPHPFLHHPSPYNYAYAPPPPPYYYPSPYYPQRPSPYGLYNGQLIPMDESKQPISREEDFLEYRKRKNEYESTNVNRPKMLRIDDLSNDDVPNTKSTSYEKSTSKNKCEECIKNNEEEYANKNGPVWFPSDSTTPENLRSPTEQEKPVDSPAVNQKYIEKNSPTEFPSDSTQSENRRNSHREEKPVDLSDNNKKYLEKNAPSWIPSDSTQSHIRREPAGEEKPIITSDYREENAPVWIPSDSTQTEIRLIPTGEQKPTDSPVVTKEFNEDNWYPSDSPQSEFQNNQKEEEIPSDSPVFTSTREYIGENVPFQFSSDSTQSENRGPYEGEEKPSDQPLLTREYVEKNSPIRFPSDSTHSEIRHSHTPVDTREYVQENAPIPFPSDSAQSEISHAYTPVVTREYVQENGPIRFPSNSAQSEIRHTHTPVLARDYEKNANFGFSSDSTQPEIRHTKEINKSNESLMEKEKPQAQREESYGTEKPIEFSSGPDRDSSPTPIEEEREERENPIYIPPSTKESPIQIRPVDKEQPISLRPVDKEQPISLRPVDKEQPIFLRPVDKEQPIYLRPVFKEEPISLPPVDKESPILLPPVNTEKPISLPPHNNPYYPTSYYPKYIDALYSEAHPRRQFVEIEGWLNKSLIPCDCQKCGQKPKLLVSYPVFQESQHRYLEDNMRVSGCPCCQRKGFCDCCSSYRNPNIPFGERFPADIDSLHQVVTPIVNYRDAYGHIHLNDLSSPSYSAGYSTSSSAGYSAQVSQVGHQKPKVSLDGYRSSSGSGYYADPCKNVYYKEPTVVDVVRTPDPCKPVLEHTKIEQPHLYKVVRKYNIVPKVVTPLVVSDLLPTNVFLCQQRKNINDGKTICHREYVPEDVFRRRHGKYFPGDFIERSPREFLDNFHASRGIHSHAPVALTREEAILRVKPVRDDYIVPIRNVMDIIPSSHFVPCRRSPREAKEKSEKSK